VATALGALAFGGLTPPTRAGILFSPNGAGGTVFNVATFDEKPGNALSQNAVALINATPVGGTTAPFLTLYQAKMGLLLDDSNNTVASPGSGGINQITVVAGFWETATRTSANTISLSSVGVNQSPPGGTASFVAMYSNPANTANDLTGAGFQDGVRIMQGVATPGTATGSFSTTGEIQQFDQFPQPTPVNN